MSSRNMCLLPRATLHSDSEQYRAPGFCRDIGVLLMYRQESILALCPLPQSQNNIVKYCVLQICRKICSAPGWYDDPLWVLCWPSVSICDWWWVRTEPPLHIQAPGRLFKLAFWRLTLSTSKRCHMDLWLAQLVLTHHHLHRLYQLPSATLPGDRVSSSFFNSGVFSLAGCLFPLFI
jgi:hypothetical protein